MRPALLVRGQGDGETGPADPPEPLAFRRPEAPEPSGPVVHLDPRGAERGDPARPERGGAGVRRREREPHEGAGGAVDAGEAPDQARPARGGFQRSSRKSAGLRRLQEPRELGPPERFSLHRREVRDRLRLSGERREPNAQFLLAVLGFEGARVAGRPARDAGAAVCDELHGQRRALRRARAVEPLRQAAGRPALRVGGGVGQLLYRRLPCAAPEPRHLGQRAGEDARGGVGKRGDGQGDELEEGARVHGLGEEPEGEGEHLRDGERRGGLRGPHRRQPPA